MKRTSLAIIAAGMVFAVTLNSCDKEKSGAPGAGDSSKASTASMSPIERGKYLVTIASCNDCHTPWKMGPKGPEQDMSRMLSGHPESMPMPPAPPPPPPWGISGAMTLTAWSGPFGTSFTANLTPDMETGLGKYSEADFIKAIRTGIMLGSNRPIMPPMPVEYIKQMTDDDLKAVYAYLRSIPAVKNKVPDYQPPMPGMPGSPGGPPMPPMPPPPPAPKKK